MNLFKRILLSITRNFSKTITLGLIIFVLGNFLVSSLYINKVTNHIENNITSELGALVSVHIKSNQDYFEYIDLFDEKFINTITNEKDDYVDQIDFALELYFLHSDNISFFDNSDGIYNQENLNLYNSQYVLGINEPNFADLRYGNITLTKGRTFTLEEIFNGDKVILLDENYVHASDVCTSVENISGSKSFKCIRSKKEIKVNDTVELSRIITNKIDDKVIIENEEYKVIGFYKLNNYIFENDFLNHETKFKTPSYNIIMPMNCVIDEYNRYLEMRYDSMNEYNLTEDDAIEYISKPLLYINSILFKYNNPNNVEIFSNNLENKLNSTYHNLLDVKTSKEDYEKVAAPLSGLNEISNLTLITSIVMSILVLSLVIIIIFRNRNKEIGIYTALGERKKNILLQFIIEIYLIGILAIGISLFTGSFLGKNICNNVMNKQIEKQQEIIENNDKLYLEYNFEKYMDIDKISLNINNIIFILIIESIVIIISSTSSILYLLKLEPKKIML